jgi:type II secretory pathway component GspD/PulD (secretin)
VPFLSDIPILGLLFRSDGKIEKNNEMIILITPRILKNPLENQPPTETAKVD